MKVKVKIRQATQPGNGVSLFLQPGSLHGADKICSTSNVLVALVPNTHIHTPF